MVNIKQVTDLLRYVSTLMSETVVYTEARKQSLNIKDGLLAPVICLYAKRSNDVINSETNKYIKSYNLSILFIKKTKLDNSQDFINLTQSELEATKDEFIYRLMNEDVVSSITSNTTEFVENLLDQNYTGVSIIFNLELFENANFCQYE